MYNPTCLITGKKDNLKMLAIRNEKEEMIGWIFLHEDIKTETINAEVKWNFKVTVDADKK